jgi:trehalose/maltose hydrolase-like predicted phosphorylase
VTTDPWVLEYTGLEPEVEGRREALCTLGNGVFATRGSAAESTEDGIHYPGTYAAGVYNRLASEVEGRRLEHESLVNLPNWLPLAFSVDGGPWTGSAEVAAITHHQVLDLRHGMLIRRFAVRDPEGRQTEIAERRIVHMAEPHLAAIEWTITPQNWSGPLRVRSWLDAGVENRNVRTHRSLAGRHLRVVDVGEGDAETCWAEVETTQSGVRCVEAARTRVSADGRRADAERSIYRGEERIGHELLARAEAGKSIVVEKVVSLFTSHDRAISEPRSAALDALAGVGGLDDLLPSHELAWDHLWRRSRIGVDAGEPEVTRSLNLHLFHLLQTLSPHLVDRDAGVGARGLHGEGYRGHVFWDEMFILPVMTLRLPEVTRALLMYRYRRLPAARRLAAEAGHRGAMYPWQSGSDGREETPTQLYNLYSKRWMADNSRRQRHVGLAIAHNVWQYHESTGDIDFFRSYGAEMLVEITRFFADLAEYDAVDGRYHIRGVMGPDEFHDGYPDRPGEGVDDNAYTNIMASWLLRRTVEVHRLLGGADGLLWERLAISPDEVDGWDRIGRGLAVPFLEGGVIAQFAGYGDLAEYDLEECRRRYPNIGRLDLILESESDSTNRYQVSKQADVLMLFYVFSVDEVVELLGHLGYQLDPAAVLETVDYYLSRTSHGSSLSRVAHAWVLSRLDPGRSWQNFREALASDIDDHQGGTTQEGLHLGAMAGTVDLVQRCYLGVEIRADAIWFDPRLPQQVETVEVALRFRGEWIDLAVAGGTLRVSTRSSASGPVRVGLHGRVVEMKPGEATSVDIRIPG